MYGRERSGRRDRDDPTDRQLNTLSSRDRILDAVRRVPIGRVATYGQIARIAGLGGHARQVGYALAALRPGSDVPWQRVINARGEISTRAWPGAEKEQRLLLEAEGVRFDEHDRVRLDRYRWSPEK